MDASVRERFDTLAAEGAAEEVNGRPFLVLLALESGARCGLTVGEEADAGGVAWAFERDGQLTPFSAAAATAYVELLEGPRDEFDEAVERGATERGLPAQDVLLSFPAVELVAAILATRSRYLTRLALLWLLPSELRALRAEIDEIANDTQLPLALRDLARRLVVPA